MDANNPGDIPEENLPEPLRRMIQEARANGDKVQVIKLPRGALEGTFEGSIGDAAEDAEEAERLRCGCQWCLLESKLVKVRDTDKLTVDQKFEAGERLFREAAEVAKDKGDTDASFSMRMQGMAVLANQRNRQWLLDAALARRQSILQQAAERFGVDAKDEEAILRALAPKIVDQAQAQDTREESITEMLTGTAYALLLKDMSSLIHTLREQPPDLKVVRVSGAALAQFI